MVPSQENEFMNWFQSNIPTEIRKYGGTLSSISHESSTSNGEDGRMKIKKEE